MWLAIGRARASASCASCSPSARTCACCRRSEREATTDALTGLGNRRALTPTSSAPRPPTRTRSVLALFDLDGFKSYNDTFGHPAGDALLERLGAQPRRGDRRHGTAYRMGGDEFCVLARAGDADVDARRARRATRSASAAGASASAARTAWSVLDGERTDPSRPCGSPTSACTRTSAAGAPDSDESVHQVLLRRRRRARRRAARPRRRRRPPGRARRPPSLGLGDADVAHVRRAAALHDIGKIAIPDDDPPRPARARRRSEWEYMRQHTVIGERIIAAAPELRRVADIVRSSHERWDGGGYPDGLAGEEIPLGARIVAVCDSFDAMTSPTAPTGAAMPVADALAELERCAGSQFDPRVVSAFRAVLTAEASARAGDGDEPRLGPRVSPTAA